MILMNDSEQVCAIKLIHENSANFSSTRNPPNTDTASDSKNSRDQDRYALSQHTLPKKTGLVKLLTKVVLDRLAQVLR